MTDDEYAYNILDEWKYRAVTAEQRVADLTAELAASELLVHHFERIARDAVATLQRHEGLSGRALDQLDEVVRRLTAEEYGPPPRQWHPARGADDA